MASATEAVSETDDSFMIKRVEHGSRKQYINYRQDKVFLKIRSHRFVTSNIIGVKEVECYKKEDCEVISQPLFMKLLFMES